EVARVAREERGIATLDRYFDAALARTLGSEGRRARVLHANNVLAHVADLHGFLDGIRTILAAGGLCLVEVPYVVDLVRRCEFDTIYHEHLCYFSLTALQRLFEPHTLSIHGVVRLAVHGSSLRRH